MMAKTSRDRMVRDRLLCGINHDNVRQRVLAKDKLDLETCIKECRRTSITSQQVRQTKTATATNGISTGMAALTTFSLSQRAIVITPEQHTNVDCASALLMDDNVHGVEERIIFQQFVNRADIGKLACASRHRAAVTLDREFTN